MPENFLYKFTKYYILVSIIYWVVTFVILPDKSIAYDIFGILLTVLPILGLIIGLKVMKQWGGISSYVGKTLLFISLAMLIWFIGQGLYTYASLLYGEVAFPGLPDYFFIFLDPLYALALISVMKYAGVLRNIRKAKSFLVAFCIPIVSLYLNYIIFFGDTSYFEVIDGAVIFDLIYSFGSIAIMTLIILTSTFSFNKLGGRMRPALWAFFVGIVIQYIGDISFTLETSTGNYFNGSLPDFIFFISISVVVMGLMKFDAATFSHETTGEKNE